MPHLTLQQRIYCVKKSYSLNNVSAVCRSYEEEFGVSVRWNTVQEIIRRFEETGSVEDRKKPGRTPSVTNDNNQLIVAEVLSEEPQNSTRRLSRELQLSQTIV